MFLRYTLINILLLFYVTLGPCGIMCKGVRTQRRVRNRFSLKHVTRPHNANDVISAKESRKLVKIFIEMQKRTERKLGYKHKPEEEKEVDYLFEEDIVLTPFQASEILNDVSKRHKRKLTAEITKRWPLPIPYTFDGTHNETEKHNIRTALDYWMKLTCIRFEEKASDYSLVFIKTPGCWSYVGFSHHRQQISIGPECQGTGTIAHEVGHAIGFWHEQSRPDRDDYIVIHYGNIKDGKEYNFEERTWKEIMDLDVPYDVGSDMHYGSKFFSKNGQYTIQTRDPLMQRVLGQRQELSFYDVKLANKAYCEKACENARLPMTCLRDGYQDPNDCSRCRCPDGFGGRFCETTVGGTKATCGGIINALHPGTISSPGYPNHYWEGITCSWLIQAPAGHHVFLKFRGPFGINCDTGIDMCKDFVEIRYSTNLGATGARFCCKQPHSAEIRSETNETLVLFRSFNNGGSTGFRLMYYTESCGGCASKYPLEQAPCMKRVAYRCSQSWQEKTNIPCPSWWRTDGCGERSVKKERYATCFRDIPHCCDSFHLEGNTCKAAEGSHVGMRYPSNRIEPSHFAHVPHGRSPIADAAFRWSPWGPWGECYPNCGGCGRRRRSRKCVVPAGCNGQEEDVEAEDCANGKPCQDVCKSVQKYQVYCDSWTRPSCTRYRTVYRICSPPYCCQGFKLMTFGHNSQCQPLHGRK